MLQLAEDLHLDENCTEILIFAWLGECETQFVFTRDEFIRGMAKANVHTVGELEEHLKGRLAHFAIDKDHKDLYEFAYKYNLDKTRNLASLKKKDCAALWRIFFTGRWNELENCIHFLRTQRKVRTVKLDTFSLLWDFILTYPTGDYNTHDPKGSWPVLLDQYVLWRSENK
ncbi:Cullin binding [Carpediemonas membranifera]|uniref:Defective in cullin neddylation protein n=1 Tax=Carpediemonas membranifera TaxID=201153 RepID=A0A8J6C006_9EUKA|nr:Cullin binding [Carpediemonas membranifera]|eukprot:KAG9396081.1 Cullin binding [Carpediemonas membranifera]